MIYITKQEGLYQNKVNSSLVFTGNCKMDYCRKNEKIDKYDFSAALCGLHLGTKR